jgi:plastocyanin
MEGRMTGRSLLTISLLALAACGGDGGNDPVDAPRTDAPAATVMTVTCPAGSVPTITTQSSSFDMPTMTIARGSIVKFVSTSTHPVGPFPGGQMTDPGITVPEGQTRCLMFTATGTFKFICTVHSYLGTITVN